MPPSARRIAIPAARALAAHRPLMLLFSAVAGAAVAAALPVTALGVWHGGLAPRLHFATLPSFDLGFGWSAHGQGPAATQEQAVAALFALLAFVAAALLAVGALTLFALAGVRTATRDGEISVARAVGAARRTIAASILLETGALFAGALAIGAAVGGLAVRLALSGWPGTLGRSSLAITAAVVGAVGAALALGLLFPAVLQRTGRVAEANEKPVGLWVPAVQLGMTLAVLTAGILMGRYATGVAGPTAGADSGAVVSWGPLNAAPAQRAAEYGELLARLQHLPAGDTAVLTSRGASLGMGAVRQLTTECGFCVTGGIPLKWHVVSATHQFVSPDSFGALGIHVIAGRGLQPGDDWAGAPVAVVNRALALRHFQDGEAVGRRVRIGDGPAARWYDVVGIADDPPPGGFGAALQPQFTVYLSILQLPPSSAELVVPSSAAVPAVRAAAAETLGLRPDRLALISGAAQRRAQAAPLAWFAGMFRAEGWAMLLLASFGGFIIMRLWVTSLRSELGLRRAVGALRRHLIGFVLWRAVRTAAASVAVALWFGPTIWSALGAVLPALPHWDTGLVLQLALLLLAAVLAGALPPALHAAHEPPVELLAGRG